MKKYPRLFLKPGRERAVLQNHPWLFSGAILSVEGNPAPGEIVLAVDHSLTPLALGFFNPGSDIIFRTFTRDVEAVIDANYLRKRIRLALSLRSKMVPPKTTAYRVINAEGDGMPGLVVDRYGSYLVICLATAGLERFSQELINILSQEIKPAGIYERSEGRARELEGLRERTGTLTGDHPPPTVTIQENGLSFEVDIMSGQKTGFFLDQRGNRACLRGLSPGAKVLNCFSYSGAFSVYAGSGGANRVVSVDASATANELAARNWLINDLPAHRHHIITTNAFNYLRQESELFDLVILDPPAFAKSLKDVPRASRGYKDINLHGIRRLSEGGILATFSCSNHINQALFEKIVLGAVRDTGKTARILAVLGPGADHPVNLAHPEGRYLKGLLLSVSNE